MKFVEIGFAFVLFVLILGALSVGVATLMGWTYVHDKLRGERKQDVTEPREEK